jgi:hypothetical protein
MSTMRHFTFTGSVTLQVRISTSIEWTDADSPDDGDAAIYLGDELRRQLPERLTRGAKFDPESIEIRERFENVVHKRAKP